MTQAATADLPELLDELTDGTGDGCIAVERTRLEGVADHVVIHANHVELVRGPMLYPDPGPVACMPMVLKWLKADKRGAAMQDSAAEHSASRWVMSEPAPRGSWDLSRHPLIWSHAREYRRRLQPLKRNPLMSQTVVTATAEAGSHGNSKGHPSGLYILFATEMWERFGFYTAAAMMTLYLQRGGFGWSKTEATTLWSNYMMFVYATPLIGGWLADKFLGYRRAVLIGGFFFMADTHCSGSDRLRLLSRPGLALHGQRLLQAECLDDGRQPLPGQQPAQGFGLQHLLHGDQHRRAAGADRRRRAPQALAGPDVLEMAKKGQALSAEQAASLRSGFLTAFYAAAAGMTLGTVISRCSTVSWRPRTASRPLEAADPEAVSVTEDLPPADASLGDRTGARIDADHRAAGHLRDRHRVLDGLPPEREHDDLLGRREHQLEASRASSPTRSIRSGSSPSPSPWSTVWNWLRKRGLEPSTPTKMAIGMFLTSLAFADPVRRGEVGRDQTFLRTRKASSCVDEKHELMAIQNHVSPIWLIAAYMVISLGELMLSPMGLSLVSKVAPRGCAG